MNTLPTNLWKFGISESQTKIDNNRYYVSVSYLAKFLDVDSGTIRYNANNICTTHKLDHENEIKKLNKESYRDADFISEELVYLTIMSLDKSGPSLKLRQTFAQILWSCTPSITLPFPEYKIVEIQQKLNELKSAIDFLSSELQKSIQYSQRTKVE